jgi:hypothetical protein
LNKIDRQKDEAKQINHEKQSNIEKRIGCKMSRPLSVRPISMIARQFKSKPARGVLLSIAGIDLAHFAYSLLFWIVGFIKWSSDWATIFRDFGPVIFLNSAFLLFVSFGASFLLAWKYRSLAGAVLGASILSAVLCFQYDALHHRYQINRFGRESGCSHVYFTWWWYNDINNPNR